MHDPLRNLRYACRVLRRNSGFAIAAVAALSLGIAANTAIFSVVNKVLLEPLPYPDPDRLVQLVTKSELGDQHLVSVAKYSIWRARTKLFEAMAAYDFAGPDVNLTGREGSRPVQTARVSADYFRVFGAGLLIGRTFSPDEEVPGGPCAAVISHQLWSSQFSASPTLVGTSVSLDHESCKIIGVLAAGFEGDKPAGIWLPIHADLSSADHINCLRVAGRLKPNVTVRLAAAEVGSTKPAFERSYPYAPLLFREEFTAIPLREALVGDVRPALQLLMGAVGLVLLIACVNAGNLTLARTSRRKSEMALRTALGAARSQIVRQLLTESVLLAIASGIAGLALGFAGVRGLLLLSPVDLPRIGSNGSAIGLDWRVFLFTLVVSISSGVLFGLAPALTAARTDIMSLVKDTTVEFGMGLRRGAGRAIPVISEVALALILMVGSGLLIRRFVEVRTTARDFDEAHVLTVQMSLNGLAYEQTAQMTQLLREVEQKVKEIPGVQAVAATSLLPLEPAITMPFTITRHDQTLVGRYHGTAAWSSVSPDYFKALRIRLLAGRYFTGSDDERSTGVVLINRFMTRKFWPEEGSNPIGEFLVIGKGVSAGIEDIPRQVVGVVEDIREAGLDLAPMMYVPVAQLPDGITMRNNQLLPITWVVRTANLQVARSDVERALRKSSGLPLGRVRTMSQVVAGSSARAQFYTLLSIVFSFVALVLVAVGLYGVLAYSVQQRRREIGVRMALGADSERIRNMVLWQGMKLALIGIVTGILMALALTRILVSLIFGVKPWDPVVICGVSVLLAGVALMASYFPSSRATAVSPCDLLRQ